MPEKEESFMALNYRKCAEEIFATLGGKDNIAVIIVKPDADEV